MVRPVGWRYESARHALAAQGVRTGHRGYYAYVPSYVAGDIPAIGIDAAGTVGAELVSFIPIVVPIALAYGGAKLLKKKGYIARKDVATRYRQEFPWLVKGFQGEDPRITDEYARFRQRNPGEFEKGSFRTVDKRDRKLILGKIDGKMAVQSVMLKRKRYWAGKDDELARVLVESVAAYRQAHTLAETEVFVDLVVRGIQEEGRAAVPPLDERGRLAFEVNVAKLREEMQKVAHETPGHEVPKDFTGGLYARKGYFVADADALWKERQRLVKERNVVLAEMESNPSQPATNKLRELTLKLRENADALDIDEGQHAYFVRRVQKKGKVHVTKGGEEVIAHAQEMVRQIRPYAKRVEIAGSIRRKKENPVDVDIVVIPRDKEKIRQKIVGQATKVYGSGGEKVSARVHGVKTEVVFAKPENWGAQLLYATGSGGHNIGLRQIAKKKGLLLNQNGVFRGSRLIAGRTERGIYRALGRPRFKQPEERQ